MYFHFVMISNIWVRNKTKFVLFDNYLFNIWTLNCMIIIENGLKMIDFFHLVIY